MSIKRILVPIPGAVDHSGEIDVAIAAAKALGAHVEALFIGQPIVPLRAVGVGGARYAEMASVAPTHLITEERERLAAEARERFSQACAMAGIPIRSATDPGTELPAASWREAEGEYVDTAMKWAPAFDLVVAASAAVMESLKDIAEQALLQTRRPVLLAPSRLDGDLTGTAMIAWDESPECWHAVSAAIPFLQLARSVQLVSVDRNAEDRRASQQEALAYLRCHGIEATARVVAPHLRSIGDTLLATADEYDAGLMVMGGYSHSRLREMLLGGATRHVLRNAAKRPVLMAH